MNVQDEIKALKDRIAELEEQVEEEQAFPKYNDFYWYANAKGKILCDTWEGFKFEKDMLAIGNVYQTENEAVFALEKLKVEAELWKISRPFEIYGTNYYLYFAKDDGFIGIACLTTSLAQGAIYFESEEKAQQAISTVGEERIKKYIFGVED